MENFNLLFSKSKLTFLGFFFLLHMGLYAQESNCNDGIDNDGDGYVDQFDPDCYSIEIPTCISPAAAPKFSIANPIKGPLNTLDPSLSPTIGDIDNDGKVEIIAPLGDSSRGYITYRVENGRVMDAGINFDIPIVSPSAGGAVVQPAIADLDRDGYAEVVTLGEDSHIYVFGHQGGNKNNYKFKSKDTVGVNVGSPRISDIDEDGVPEIITGNKVFKLDIINRQLLLAVDIPSNYPSGYAGTEKDIVVIDILSSNPGKEIVAGSVIYGVNLDTGAYTILKNLNSIDSTVPLYADGPTAVADLDLDGDLDVAFCDGTYFYIWDPTEGKLLLKVEQDNANGGLPTISNIYDDIQNDEMTRDYPEVLVVYNEIVVMYNLQLPKSSQWKLETTDASGRTGITSFDFNGDGVQEIVYSDTENIRIINGNTSNPENLASFIAGSATWYEHPVVADIDDDNQAEMISFAGPSGARGGLGNLNIFKAGAGTVWQPARKIWNQRGYSVVNINDNLTVPRQETKITNLMPVTSETSRVLNQYNVQLNPNHLFLEPGMVEGIDVQLNVIESYNKSTRDLTLELAAINGSIPSGLPITIYNSDPTKHGATVIGTYSTTAIIPSGSVSNVTIKTDAFQSDHIYAVVNDNGSIPTPFDLSTDFPSTALAECNYENNIAEFIVENLLPPISGGNQIVCAISDSIPTLTAQATLVNGEGTIVWYDAPTGGNVITPTLDTFGEVTYYAQATAGNYSSNRTPVYLRIDPTPEIDTINDQSSCNPFVLPPITGTNLTENIAYYTETAGQGIQYFPGDTITTPGVQELYIFDEFSKSLECPIGEDIQTNLEEDPALYQSNSFRYPKVVEKEFWNGNEVIELLHDYPESIQPSVSTTVYNSIIGDVRLPGIESCTLTEETIELEVSVDVTNLGPDNVQSSTGGGILIINTATNALIDSRGNIPAIATNATSTVTISGIVSIADIISGNIGLLIQVESHQGATKRSWRLENLDLSFLAPTSENNICSAEESFTISLQDEVTPGIISEDQIICESEIPEPLMSDTPGSGSGDLSYIWEKSTTDALSGFSIIPSATSEDYVPEALTQTTYYRRTTVSDQYGIQCESEPTNVVTITVNPSIENNLIDNDRTLCDGVTPEKINVSVPTGGTGAYTFLWEQSIDGGLNWEEADGIVDQVDYQPLVTTTDIQYRRIVSDGICSSISNIMSIDVIVKPVGYDDTVTGLDCTGKFTYDLQENINDITNGGNGVLSDFSWEIIDNSSVLGGFDGVGSTIEQSLINTTSSLQTLTYLVTATSQEDNSCSTTFELVVEVPVCNSLTITKIADIPSVDSAGDIINYTIEITNTGNAAHFNTMVYDSLLNKNLITPTGDINEDNILESGEVWVYTDFYETKQSDLDNNGIPMLGSGEIQNMATVTSDQMPGRISATNEVSLLLEPRVGLTKTSLYKGDPTKAKAGDVITYTFTLTNLGNISINSIEVNDPLLGGSIGGPLNGDDNQNDILELLEAWHYEADYTITQNDVDRGYVNNQATIEGLGANGDAVSDLSGDTNLVDSVNRTDLPTFSAIALVKTASFNDENGDTYHQAGETINYSFLVKNTGYQTLTNIDISDPLVTINASPIASLAPRVTDSTTFKAVYTIKQTDIDRGYIENQAKVQGVDPADNIVEDMSGTEIENDFPTVMTLSENPILKAVKTASINDNGDGVNGVGDEIVYTITVQNIGNVTLSNVALNDTFKDALGNTLNLTTKPVFDRATLGSSEGNLLVGEAAIYTATYIVEQQAVDAAEVRNSVTVSGESPSGTLITDISDNGDNSDGNIEDDPTVTTFLEDPKLEATKEAFVNDNGDGINGVGDEVIYTITVQNIGNVTLTNIALTDTFRDALGNTLTLTTQPTFDHADDGSSEGNLLVGETATYTASFLVNQQVVDAGGVSNSVLVEASTLLNTNLSDLSDDGDDNDGNTEDDPSITTFIQDPVLEATNTAAITDNGDGVDGLGDEIIYTISVRNTGNVTLSNIVLVDTFTDVLGNKLNLSGEPTFLRSDANSLEGDLLVGETAIYTASYVIEQQALDAGGVSNSVLAQGLSPLNEPVSDISDNGNDSDGNTQDDPTINTFSEAPELEVIKTAEITDNGDGVIGLGDEVVYTIVVKNTGNVTLNNLKLTDTFTDVLGNKLDLTTEPVFNSADSGSLEGSLLVGETSKYTATYIIDQVSVDAGGVRNSVLVEAFSLLNTKVEDISDNGDDTDGNSVDDPTETLIQETPLIEATKTAVVSQDGGGDTGLGDEIVYTITVQNTGNVTLSNVTITDTFKDALGNTLQLTTEPVFESADKGSLEGDLLVGETARYLATFKVNQGALDSGGVRNSVLVEGNSPAGTRVSDISDNGDDSDGNTQDDSTDTDFLQIPMLEVTKIATLTDNGDGVKGLGDEITYSITVQNTGNVSLKDITITDTFKDALGNTLSLTTEPVFENADKGSLEGSLSVGETALYSATYIVGQKAVNTGGISNSVLIEGYSPLNKKVFDVSDDGDDTDGNTEDDPTETEFNHSPMIEVTKVASVTDNGDGVNGLGDEIIYTITAKNTGNVTLDNIILTDTFQDALGNTLSLTSPPVFDGADKGSVEGSLSVDETARYTATFTVTQDAVDAGGVRNSVLVEGYSLLGTEVTDISDNGDDTDGNSVDDPTITVLYQNPTIEVTKTVDIIDNGDGYNGLSDELLYTITVKNTGNVTISTVTLTDTFKDDLGRTLILTTEPVFESADMGSLNGDLLVGETASYSASFIVTQEAVDAGGVSNSVLAGGYSSLGSHVTDLSDDGDDMDGNTEDDVTQVSFVQTPQIEATKIMTIQDNGDGLNGLDDEITFTITLENNGNVTLHNVTLTDTFKDALGNSLNLTTEPVFESADKGSMEGHLLVGETATYLATYRVTQDAVDSGGASNSVVAEAFSLLNTKVSDISDDGDDMDGNSQDDITEVSFVQLPQIEATKTMAIRDNGDGEVGLNDEIIYTISLKNTGNVSLFDVSLTDTFKDASGNALNLTKGPDFNYADMGSSETSLLVGESANYTASFRITQEVIDAGGVTNSVLSTAESLLGERVTDISDDGDDTDGNTTDDTTDLEITANPSVNLILTSETTGRSEVGDVIIYTFVATNTGNVTLRDVVVDNSLIGVTNLMITPSTLAPGISGIATAIYEITKEDIAIGNVTNSAFVEGVDPSGTKVGDISGTRNNNDDPTIDIVPKSGPIAYDDSEHTSMNQSVHITIIANDIAFEADLLPQSIEIIDHPSHGTVELQGNGIAIYTPYSGRKFSGTDTFTYRIQDSYNVWSNMATVTVSINGLFIPNTITPNGDGVNDSFEIIGIENYQNVVFHLYNRVGNQVYRNEQYNNEFKGDGLNEGTYYYVLELTDKQGHKEHYKGWLFMKF